MALLFLTPLLAGALLLASYLSRDLSHEALKGSAYECGFIPTEGQTFSPFAVTFFVVGILFLLFDLELLFIFPVVVAHESWLLRGASLFFIFLVLSLAYEIGVSVVRLSVSTQRMLVSLSILFIILAVAYLTLADRKGIALLQRRVGPNSVGVWGLLQPFADALKLLTKELVYPDQILSGLSQALPALTLSCGLAGYVPLPFCPTVAVLDFALQILVTLSLIGIALHGVLYIAWGAGNSFSFLGSLRTAAQLVSYELPLTTVLFIACLTTGSFSYFDLWGFNSAHPVGMQLLPAVPIFLAAALAETARTPFDLPEAESELVAGFITEMSAAPFVLYFLAEYSSLAFMALVSSVVFIASAIHVLQTVVLLFVAVWLRATLPRLRYDQLMVIGWNVMLPLAVMLAAGGLSL